LQIDERGVHAEHYSKLICKELAHRYPACE
jgi:hypothetical protein